ncbi:MAG TPA: hypothetical protein VGC86_08290 [Afipia sp.]
MVFENFSMWMPVIVAVITALLGIFTFWNQKSAERRARYKLDVQERYEKYLHSIFDVMAKHSDQDRHAAFHKMQVSLRLFASADVLRKAKQFEEHVTRVRLVDDPNQLAASLVNAMRNHALPQRWFSPNSISDSEMTKLNSFNV